MAVKAGEKDSLIYAVIQDYSEKIFYFCIVTAGNGGVDGPRMAVSVQGRDAARVLLGLLR